jgi:hypothetical protein
MLKYPETSRKRPRIPCGTKTETESRDDLLRDIVQTLASQNAGNWEAVRAELIEILKEAVPQ